MPELQDLPELSDLEALQAGQYVRCGKCGAWVGPSDPGWEPAQRGGVLCGVCANGLDLGPGVFYAQPAGDDGAELSGPYCEGCASSE